MVVDAPQAALAIDVYPIAGGTIHVGSRDLWTDTDSTNLGAFYKGVLLNQPVVTTELPDTGAGVDVVGDVILEFRNKDTDGTILFDSSLEWRDAGVRIRYWEPVGGVIETWFQGVISEPDISDTRATFVCINEDDAVLDQLIPAQVVEIADNTNNIIDDIDAGTTRADVGSAIPVVFGDGGLVNPPYIGLDLENDPGGADFLCGWGTAPLIKNIFWDIDSQSPGLEAGTLWTAAEGTPVKVSSSVFTVTDAILLYEVGMPIRYDTTGAGGWSYSHVSSFAGGTVTLNDAIITGAIGTVQQAGDYAIEKNRYKFVDASGTTFLTSFRFFANPNAAPLASMSDTSLTNPADVVKFILEDNQVGLGQTVNAASFTQAATDFSTAGLATAIRGVLGGDRRQRRARDVINEMARMRGVRVYKDENKEWHFDVDTEPTAASKRFRYGSADREDREISQLNFVRKTPLRDAIKSAVLKYNIGGRQRGAKPLEQMDYGYRASMSVLSVGRTLTIESPWLRDDHTIAARVLYYIGTRQKHADEKISFSCGHYSGQGVTLGELIIVDAPDDNINAKTYRVRRIAKSLIKFDFLCEGYNSEIYTFDAGDVTTPAQDLNQDERDIGIETDGNLLSNPDFTTGLRKDFATISGDDLEVLPGWFLDFQGGGLTDFDVVYDQLTKGGAYLKVITDGTASAGSPVKIHSINEPSTSDRFNAVSVDEKDRYIVAAFMGDGTNTLATGWRFQLEWYTSNKALITPIVSPVIRSLPNDKNGLAWRRFYAVVRSPTNARYAIITISFEKASQTFSVDAVSFERVVRRSLRPTPWNRNPRYGVSPVDVTTGDFAVRYDNEKEHGTFIHNKAGLSWSSGGVQATGGTVVLGTIPPGLVTCVTGRVTTGLTFSGGGTTWGLGLQYAGGTTPNVITTGLGTAATTTFSDAEMHFSTIRISQDTQLIATPDTGTFSDGTIKATIHYLDHKAPTS